MADVFVSSSNTPFWPPYWIEASQTYFKHLICFVTHELESILYLLPAILVLVIRILNWGKGVVMGHSVQSFSAHIFKFWFDLFAVHLHHSQIPHFLALFKNSFYLFFHSLWFGFGCITFLCRHMYYSYSLLHLFFYKQHPRLLSVH